MTDNLRDKMHRAAKSREGDQKVAQEKIKDASRQRLLKIMETKLRTAFIGAIAQFEEHFGKAWGHGLTDDECTEKQLAVRRMWEVVRTNILNNGNNQLRAVQSEIVLYEVLWQRYQTKLPVLKGKTDNV